MTETFKTLTAEQFASLDYSRYTLVDLREPAELIVSGNIVKNVKSVVVPNTGGRKGLRTAVAAGLCFGKAEKELEVIADALGGFNHSKYPWIEWDEQQKAGKFLHRPERADIPENIKEQLIVELYSKN